MALRQGYKLVPTMVLGEHQIYQTVDSFKTLRLLANKIKLPGVFYSSKYGVLPDPNFDIYTIVGKPI
jgi:hypothetical protein